MRLVPARLLRLVRRQSTTTRQGQGEKGAMADYRDVAVRKGLAVMKDQMVNQGVGFPVGVREELGIKGLIPPTVESLSTQMIRIMHQFRSRSTDLERYLYLRTLKNSNSALFYRAVLDHMDEIAPVIYTPTVGEACIKFSHIYNSGIVDGMYLSLEDRGRVKEVLRNWPYEEVDISVVTDGSRILGLGDLGVNGMGIPIGKLSLYIAAAGFHPHRALPLTLDLGCNTPAIVNDPVYLGTRRERPDDDTFYEFVDEVMVALKERWPHILVQFEDFSAAHAFGTLDRYRESYRMFNDDIQGTGAVILSGFINAVKLSGVPVREQRLLFYGAGSAGVGVAVQLRDHLMKAGGMSEEEANAKFWLMDTKGLVTMDRGDTLAPHKLVFARKDNNGLQLPTINSVIDHVKPTALIGLSTQGGVFTPDIIRKMAEINTRPIIMPLSNPLKNAECTFDTAMRETEGRVLFASGTAFPAYTDPKTGKVSRPGQGNNMYIFPGLGLGASISRATKITDSMIYVAAAALADSLSPNEIAEGLIYPRLMRIREISAQLAADVSVQAVKEGLAENEDVIKLVNKGDLEGLLKYIRESMYEPHYKFV